MTWSKLRFGKYESMTLPQVILCDPDWFFYMQPKLYGDIGQEAEELSCKAKAIKIPRPHPEDWSVEYSFDRDGRFLGFHFVRADAPMHARWSYRLPHLDLSCVRRQREYDKIGGRKLIRDFRTAYFGCRKRLTRQRCEAFFSQDRNFVGTITLTDD